MGSGSGLEVVVVGGECSAVGFSGTEVGPFGESEVCLVKGSSSLGWRGSEGRLGEEAESLAGAVASNAGV